MTQAPLSSLIVHSPAFENLPKELKKSAQKTSPSFWERLARLTFEIDLLTALPFSHSKK